MQFTYSFPPIMRFGYDVITDAMAADEPYVPGSGSRGRVDTWRQWSRWKRVRFYSFFLSTSSASFFFLKIIYDLKQGLFGGRWYYKLFNVVLFFGGTVTACLG